jgi:HSP20 family protein
VAVVRIVQPAPTAGGERMNGIDETIAQVEQLYVEITGSRPPAINGNSAPIPPESDPVRHVEDQLRRLMEAVQRATPAAAPVTQQQTWMPQVTAWREGDVLEIALDVAGVPREQIDVRLDDRTLIVQGHRSPPWRTAEPPQVEACEMSFGTFTRAFTLGASVSPEHISARLDAGVLRVRVTRATRTEPSQIPIKV